jgi:hypothetical protein
MMIIVRHGFFMGMTREDLNLIDPKCKPKRNGTHFIFTTGLTECGTEMTKTPEAFVYKNVIRERPPSRNSMITRLHDVDIPFRCFYTRRGATSALALEPSRKVIRANASDTGMFALHMGVFKDFSYTVPYPEQDFPIPVMVNRRIYFQLSVQSMDNRLSVRADRCHATPDPNRNNRIQYDLIRNGYDILKVHFGNYLVYSEN